MTSDQSKYIASVRNAYMDFVQKNINKKKIGNRNEARFNTIKMIYLKKYIEILYNYFNTVAEDNNYFDSTKAMSCMEHISEITGKKYFLKLT
jgi:hypothetical protein